MSRLWLVLAAVALVVALTLGYLNALALTVGLLAGLVFFLRGLAAGGGLGNARGFGRGPADVSARIGICLAAAGIASSSVGSAHFPVPFRVFYGLCLGLACVIAVFLAWRGRR